MVDVGVEVEVVVVLVLIRVMFTDCVAPGETTPAASRAYA
jgi:hypothetical protein